MNPFENIFLRCENFYVEQKGDDEEEETKEEKSLTEGEPAEQDEEG